MLKALIAVTRHQNSFYRRVLACVSIGILLSPWIDRKPAQAQVRVPCQLPAEAGQQKENLRLAALRGDREAQNRYQALIAKQAAQLQECRTQNWPRNQAIWLRLYPCDIRPGSLGAILDRIVNKGYNEVYVEVFYDGQVLLPQTDNPTPWQSVVQVPGAEKYDLLAEAIDKGRKRGLKVYAWAFTMNFGYVYAQQPDRQSVLARNGTGKTSLEVANDAGIDTDLTKGDASKAFIDPYNPQARQDYEKLIEAITKRKPDGVLFDYVRYPRGTGDASVVTKVQDLWIYGDAAKQVLLQRAINSKGLDLIRRFLTKGYVTTEDIAQVDQLYPEEQEPLWQGRNPDLTKSVLPPGERQPMLQTELWQLSVAHAAQGVLDFVTAAIGPLQRQGIRTGAVFFPGGNQSVGQGGYDSRIQPWDKFPSSMEWHPMLYANCGESSCILNELQRVLGLAPLGTEIKPALAGDWGRSLGDRPSLEVQMAAIRQAAPQINTVSHFAFSWQEPESDRERKFCRLR
ncbi:family 10 glycosylhydrolase [Argonema galeatum]|uniref:family 10 glycosylhydrolase n=1 Tax=Argonema galeatum TaxID=2942762 RepID=UPI002012BE71|nr:family 10 glycosylhydrolase [Argonema galeatum]MCL1468809.1 family 10 glycosylhydrolase [Argonema galeatum A003/A1]